MPLVSLPASPDPTPFAKATHWDPMKKNFDLMFLGQLVRGVYAGGDWDNGVDASSAGDLDVRCAVPFSIDNTSSDFSSGVVCQFNYYCRVSNGAISVTPKVVYGTDGVTFGSVATIAGEAACSATSALYTGANQFQQVSFVLPAGVKWFKTRFTVAGTPAPGYQAWLFVTRDLHV